MIATVEQLHDHWPELVHLGWLYATSLPVLAFAMPSSNGVRIGKDCRVFCHLFNHSRSTTKPLVKMVSIDIGIASACPVVGTLLGNLCLCVRIVNFALPSAQICVSGPKECTNGFGSLCFDVCCSGWQVLWSIGSIDQSLSCGYLL